jgi:Tfp pilus assembly protein PilN
LFQILALEIDGPVIRCAVVARTGLKKVRISQCESFARLEEEGAPLGADELTMVTARLTVIPRDCVAVIPGAALLQVALPETAGGKRKGKLRGGKLAAALRQETEAYTGMAAAEMLLGYERLPEEENEFWVTAFPLEEYRHLKETLAEGGLKLRRVYPPDCCFAVAASRFAPPGRERRLVLEAGRQNLRLAAIERGRLYSCRTAPLFAEQPYREATREDWEGWLAELGLERAELARVWHAEPPAEGPRELVVTGAGSLEEAAAALQSFFNGGAVALAMPVDGTAGGVCGGDYAAVVGAALRELLMPWFGRALGVSDRLPLLQTVARKAYLAPVSVLLLAFLVFGGHYLLITRQIGAAQGELATLEREREEVRAAVARMQGDEKKVTELTDKRRLAADKVDYLQNRLPAYGRLLHAVLAAMEAEGGTAIKFVRIELLDRGAQFIVSGESADSVSIHRLAVALQGERWCAFAKVEEIVREVRREEAAAEPGFAEELPGPLPPEAGLLPGEELPGMEPGEEAAMIEADPFAALPEPGAEAEEQETVTVVFTFRTRVVVRPEFFPERPFEEKGQPVTGGTGERAL